MTFYMRVKGAAKDDVVDAPTKPPAQSVAPAVHKSLTGAAKDAVKKGADYAKREYEKKRAEKQVYKEAYDKEYKRQRILAAKRQAKEKAMKPRGLSRILGSKEKNSSRFSLGVGAQDKKKRKETRWF